MYLKVFLAAEEAIELLIAAQREAEEIFLSEEEPELRVIEIKQKTEDREKDE